MLPPSVRAVTAQRQRRPLGDVTGGQLLAQLGVGGPQFAITDPRLGQFDAQRARCIIDRQRAQLTPHGLVLIYLP
jgi:hypothetical protein